MSGRYACLVDAASSEEIWNLPPDLLSSSAANTPGRVEPRQAAPVDRAVGPDQGRRRHVTNQAVTAYVQGVCAQHHRVNRKRGQSETWRQSSTQWEASQCVERMLPWWEMTSPRDSRQSNRSTEREERPKRMVEWVEWGVIVLLGRHHHRTVGYPYHRRPEQAAYSAGRDIATSRHTGRRCGGLVHDRQKRSYGSCGEN